MTDLKHRLQSWVSSYAAPEQPIELLTCTGCLKQFTDLDSAVAHVDEEEAFQRTAEMQLEEEKKAPAPKPEPAKPAEPVKAPEPPKVDPALEAHKQRMKVLAAGGKLVVPAAKPEPPKPAPVKAPEPVKETPADPVKEAHTLAMARLKQRLQAEEAALKGCGMCSYRGPDWIVPCTDHQPKPAKVELKKCHPTCEEQLFILFSCPHCGGEIQVKQGEVNCGIFRHATYKHSGEPVEPHTSQVAMQFLCKSGAVRGCGLPFRLSEHEGSWKAVKCDWI